MATIDMGRKEGGCCALFAGAGTPSSTTWPGPRSTSVASGVFIHQATGHNRHGPKLGAGGCALSSGVAWSTSNTVSHRPRPTSVRKWHLDPCSHLATIDVGRKFGWGSAPFGVVGWVSI